MQTGSSTWQVMIRELSQRHEFSMWQFILPPGLSCPPPAPRPCISVVPERVPRAKYHMSRMMALFYNGSRATYFDWHFAPFNHSDILRGMRPIPKLEGLEFEDALPLVNASLPLFFPPRHDVAWGGS